MAPGCLLQRHRTEVYKRIDSVREAAIDRLVNADDNAMTQLIKKPHPKNIVGAATLTPNRCTTCPSVTANPEDTREASSGLRRATDVVGFDFTAKVGKQILSTFPVP